MYQNISLKPYTVWQQPEQVDLWEILCKRVWLLKYQRKFITSWFYQQNGSMDCFLELHWIALLPFLTGIILWKYITKSIYITNFEAGECVHAVLKIPICIHSFIFFNVLGMRCLFIIWHEELAQFLWRC